MDTYIKIDSRTCTACGYCIKACPFDELYAGIYEFFDGTIKKVVSDKPQVHRCHICDDKPCKKVCSTDSISWIRR